MGLPAELLQVVERAGFEPLACEALADTLWEDHYRMLDAGLSRLAGPDGEQMAKVVRREIDVYVREGGRHSVTYTLIIARRKEPGERPPPARTRA